MFCSKCGTKLNDDAVFCSECGNRVAQPQEAPASEAPTQAPTDNSGNYSFNDNTPSSTDDSAPLMSFANGAVKIPNKFDLIGVGLAIITFIFMLLPWLDIWGLESVGMLREGMFDVSAMFGLAKVVCIINIILFIAYLIAQFVDVKKFVPQIPEHIDLKKFSAYAFIGGCVLQWIFALLGRMTNDYYIELTACFVIAIIFVAAFAVTVFKKDLVEELLGKVINK